MKLRHVGITVVDIERSLEFYIDMLGFKIQRDMEEHGDYIDNFSGLNDVHVRTVKLSGSDGSLIELLQYRSHPSNDSLSQARLITSVGCSHFALTVEDLDELYDKLYSSGIRFKSTPQISPDGNAKIAFCQDPDGALVELVEEL